MRWKFSGARCGEREKDVMWNEEEIVKIKKKSIILMFTVHLNFFLVLFTNFSTLG